MNIVIPFRNTCGTQELKLCISLIKKNCDIDLETIYVLGDDIGFQDPLVSNILIKEQKYNKWLDSNFLVEFFIENMSKKPFILFNDDFFITSKITMKDISYYYFNTLTNRIKTTYIIEPKTDKLKLSAYGLNIKKFIDIYKDYDNYEVHIPMPIYYPEEMATAIKISKEYDCPAMKRTLYMKILEMKGLDLKAPKVALPHDIKFGEPLRVIQYPFFSLTDTEYKAFEEEFNKILSN